MGLRSLTTRCCWTMECWMLAAPRCAEEEVTDTAHSVCSLYLACFAAGDKTDTCVILRV
jgi:hypothetical protein